MDLAAGSSSRHLRTHLFLSGRNSDGGSSSAPAISTHSSASFNKMSRIGNGRVMGRSQLSMGEKDSDTFMRRRNNNINNNKNMNNYHHVNNVNGVNPSIQISCPISMNSPLINYKKYNHTNMIDNEDDEDDDDDLDDIMLGLSDEYETSAPYVAPYDPIGLRANGGRSTRVKAKELVRASTASTSAAAASGSSIFFQASSSPSASSSSSSSAVAATSSSSSSAPKLYATMTQLDVEACAANTHQRREFNLSSDEHVQEDCFIIPAHRMSVFLPLPFLESERRHLGSLNATHVDAPKISIIFHFAEPIGCYDLPTAQLTSFKRLLLRVKELQSANDGMLLINLEKNSMYPFIVYLVLNTTSVPVSSFLHYYNDILEEELQVDKLSNTIQSEIGQGLNYIGGYEEVATIARPPIDLGPKTPSNPKTGYLITIFKVFPGEDREKLERSWLLWTGARVIYKHLPECLGMKRMTFHKKLRPDGGITYVLVCECNNLMEYVTVACDFVEHLRARCCGYTALYKSADKF